MFAILCEHTGGKWPFWLSPRQAIVIPVAPQYNEYAKEVQAFFHLKDYAIDIDDSTATQLQKKVRNACVAHYNFIFVVGDSEANHKTVNVRTRDGQLRGEFSLEAMGKQFEVLSTTRRLNDDPVDVSPYEGAVAVPAGKGDVPATST